MKNIKLNFEVVLIFSILFHVLATTTQIFDPLAENYRIIFENLWGKNSWIYPWRVYHPISSACQKKKKARLLFIPWIFLFAEKYGLGGLWGKNIYSFFERIISNEGIIILNIFAFISIGIIYFHLDEHLKKIFKNIAPKEPFQKSFD